MRPQPETIRLGSEEWLVRPLTLRQVQAIEPVLIVSAKENKNNIKAAIEIVSIALQRDHLEASKILDEIEATAGEIGAAMTQILRLGGFINGLSGETSFLVEAGAGSMKLEA